MYTNNVFYLNGLDGKKKRIKREKKPRGLNPNVLPFPTVTPPVYQPSFIPNAPSVPSADWSRALPAGITAQDYSAPVTKELSYLKIGLYAVGALGVMMLLLKKVKR